VKEARRAQENKERAEEFRAEQEAEAAERAKAQAEADALAAAELEKVIQQEATGDSWGWGEGQEKASGEKHIGTCGQPSFMACFDHSDTSCIAGDANAAPEESEAVADARVEQAIDDGIASLSAGFASGLEAFSEVR
jgi:hypothetical protein